MQVTLIDHMGSDLTVCNAARVSFNKTSDWNYSEYEKMYGLKGTELHDKDKKLISYLAKHNHWSPFSHPQIQLHIKAPIFVARQLAKHQVGLAWNEVSRRYVDTEPEFYIPKEWRIKAEDKKQGSSEDIITEWDIKYEDFWVGCLGSPFLDVSYLVDHCKDVYKKLIERGVCPEMARMVLPQNTYTEWYWTGSLYAFARVYNLRIKLDAQKETQKIAKQIGEIIEPLFPISWSALIKEDSNG